MTARASQRSRSEGIELGSTGASLFLELAPNVIGGVTVAEPAPIRGSGTDLTLGAQELARSPASGSLPNLLLQLPGAARGAKSVVHINGEHGDINHIIDGVSVPQELNRIIGTELDINDIAFIDVLQGAYPAQYGERFASVLNISSNAGIGPSAGTALISGGSCNEHDSALGYHTKVGRVGSSSRAGTRKVRGSSIRRISTRRTIATATRKSA